MEFSHKLKALLLCLMSCWLSPTAFAWEPEESIEGLESFFAISGILGNRESDSLNGNFQRDQTRDTFFETNLEIQLRWNGLFYENPGRSQESIDGLFSGDAIGYNFYNNKYWALDIYAVNAFPATEGAITNRTIIRDEDTGEVLEDSTRRLEIYREADYRLGLRATGYYEDYLAQLIVTPVSLRSKIGGFNASASLRRTWLIKNWNIYATVGLNYQSEEILDHFFGLSPSEAAAIAEVAGTTSSPFQTYEASDGFSGVGEIGFEYPLSEHFVFGGFVTGILRADAVTNSPFAISGREFVTAGLSITWVF